MSDLLATVQYFHFLRPWWLALIPVALILWWRIRSRATAGQGLPGGIAPHLAAALTVGGGGLRRIYTIDGAALVLSLISLAAAGPTWNRIPNPLIAQTAPLAVALEVSETMLATDISPNRLERAKHKIIDVIVARTGARTALIAYAGTAHRVAPLTEDPDVLKPFLEGLSPDVMPEKGQDATAALGLARAVLSAEQVPGAILFVLDDLDRADLPAFERHAAEGGPRIVFLSVGGAGAMTDDLARIPGAAVVRVTPDGSDVDEIDRKVASAYRDALARDERQKWDDRGWILAWPAMLLTLLWFRRGWTMRWSVILVVALTAAPNDPAHAGGIADWFLTADQQGRLAYDQKEFDKAADLFEDPMWKGHSLYRVGKYAEAAGVFGRLQTAEAAFAQGMAHVKTREYREGIAAFEKALERDPDYPAAARNLEIASAILEYVERVREQSDTGEESGIGADDVVFDNESDRGAETTIDASSKMKMDTAEQWMRTVDTRTEDFLRTRFALEALKDRP